MRNIEPETERKLYLKYKYDQEYHDNRPWIFCTIAAFIIMILIQYGN